MAQPTRTETGTTGDVDKEALKKALMDGLVGRKALMRAYERVSERIDDSETKTMLRRFADEEKQEYQAAEEIARKYGGDPGAVQNVKEEVASMIGKTFFKGGEGAYKDARDLAMLYSLESGGHIGADFMKHVANRVDDADWKQKIDQSIERCQNHTDYLKGRIEDLGDHAFRTGGT